MAGSEALRDTTASTEVAASEQTNTTGASTEPSTEDATTGSGVASLTIGNMSLEFCGLACFYDAAAAEAYGNEDAALRGRPRTRGGLGQLHMTSTDAEPTYVVEEGRVTANGEFELVFDSRETGTVELGRLEATCG